MRKNGFVTTSDIRSRSTDDGRTYFMVLIPLVGYFGSYIECEEQKEEMLDALAQMVIDHIMVDEGDWNVWVDGNGIP